MKKFIFSMLFCLFAFTSFATPHEVKIYDNTEQTFRAVDVVSVDVFVFEFSDGISVNKRECKTNDFALITNYFEIPDVGTWQNYFYSENLIENYNLQFKDRIYNGMHVTVFNE